jgi:hypothetical protein
MLLIFKVKRLASMLKIAMWARIGDTVEKRWNNGQMIAYYPSSLPYGTTATGRALI